MDCLPPNLTHATPMSQLSRIQLLGAVAAGFALTACNDSDGTFTITSIGSSLNGLGLTTLSTAVAAAGLGDELDADGPLTVFAPSNAAFGALTDPDIASLLNPLNEDLLIDILERHVVSGTAIDAAAAGLLSSTPTLGGASVLIDTVGGELYVNDALVTEADITADNGVIHRIDTVLTAPEDIYTTLTTRGLTTLVTAIDAAELDDDLQAAGDFTLLAPTNSAFSLLPAGELTDLLADQPALISRLNYHLVTGTVARASEALEAELIATTQGSNVIFSEDDGVVLVNGVEVRTFNIQATNGIIHVINAVLIEPTDIPTTATDLGLTTFAGLLEDASLTATLSDPGAPFTVFAPIEAAFSALDPDDLAYLTDVANVADLTAVLEYHAVMGTLSAADVLDETELTTLEGTTFAVDGLVDPATVGGIPLESLNIPASNGIVHTIGGVLIPDSVVPNLPSSATFLGATGPDAGAEPLVGAQEPAGFADLMQDGGAAALPAWAGTSAALVGGWDRFEGAGGAGLAPDAAGSSEAGVLLVAGRTAVSDAQGDLGFANLAGDVRIDAALAAVPFEVVLQVAGSGLEQLAPELRIAVDGQVQMLAADELELLPTGELLAIWRPTVAGASTEGIDAVVVDGQLGVELEAVRFLALK